MEPEHLLLVLFMAYIQYSDTNLSLELKEFSMLLTSKENRVYFSSLEMQQTWGSRRHRVDVVGEEKETEDSNEKENEKENENISEEKDVQSQTENEVSSEEHNDDGAAEHTHEAREENYKADDTSSMVRLILAKRSVAHPVKDHDCWEKQEDMDTDRTVAHPVKDHDCWEKQEDMDTDRTPVPLLRIEEELGAEAAYAGANFRKPVKPY
nr:cilia- and flagella-associated protein 251-like [Tanacetum cinerariifolium]